MTNRKVLLKKAFLYALAIISLGIILYFWYINSYDLLFKSSAETLISLGRISALFAVYCILMQLLLIGRIAWIEKTFGHDKLSNAHHINGLIAWTFIIIHPILIILGYASLSNTSFISQLGIFITSYQYAILAVMAFIIFGISIGVSINLIKRKLKYEYWVLIHIFVYAAILLAFLHQVNLGGDFTNPFFIGYWYFLYVFAFGNLIIFIQNVTSC